MPFTPDLFGFWETGVRSETLYGRPSGLKHGIFWSLQREDVSLYCIVDIASCYFLIGEEV